MKQHSHSFSKSRRHLEWPAWILFGAISVFLRLLEGLWLGFADEIFHFDAVAILEVCFLLASWAFLPRAIPYRWIVWPLLLWLGLFSLMPASALLAQAPVGNEQIPLGWEGNMALMLTLLACLFQIRLFIQCLEDHAKSKQD